MRVGLDRADVEDRQMAVGVHAVPTAVAGVVAGGEVAQDLDPHRRLRAGDGVEEVVPLDVDVGVDLRGGDRRSVLLEDDDVAGRRRCC